MCIRDRAKTILIVSAEALSRFCDWKDRSTCVLFGDGAGAVVVGEGDGLIGTKLFAQSNEPILYAYGDPGNSPYEREKHPLTPLHMACLLYTSLVQHKLSVMRDKKTSVKDFRTLVGEIAMLNYQHEN